MISPTSPEMPADADPGAKPGYSLRRYFLAFACLGAALAGATGSPARAEGAFAFGQHGIGGWGANISQNYPTQADAEIAALQGCNTRSPNCMVRFSFRKTCFAFAVQNSGNGWGTGTGSTPTEAQRYAMEKCQSYGMACSIRGAVCDQVSEEEERAAAELRAAEKLRAAEEERAAEQRRAAVLLAEVQKYYRDARECQSGASLSEAARILAACDAALASGNMPNEHRPVLLARRNSLGSLIEKERVYRNDYKSCTEQYDIAKCDSANASPIASGVDTVMIAASRAIAEIFAAQFSLCKSGSALACDRAMGMTQIAKNHLAEILAARSNAALASKLWAGIVPASIAVVKPASDALERSTGSKIELSDQLSVIVLGIFAALALGAIKAVTIFVNGSGSGALSSPAAAFSALGTWIGAKRDERKARAESMRRKMQAVRDSEAASKAADDTIAEKNPAKKDAAKDDAPQDGTANGRAGSTSQGTSQGSGFDMTSLLALIANGPLYVLLYLVFMIPTYILPYWGSNSAILNAGSSAAGLGLNPGFWLHLVVLSVLCALAWLRGAYVGKQWLVTFPFVAMAFDLVPGLNFVPFVPTVMHLCAIIVGVSSARPQNT